MPSQERGTSRGELRSWLKLTLASGVLDRLPAAGDPSGPTGGRDPSQFALELLERLKAQDGGLRLQPADPLLVEFRAFRRWVERERRDQRLRLQADGPRSPRRASRLAESEPEPEPTPWPHPAPAKPFAIGSGPSLADWLARVGGRLGLGRTSTPADPSGPLWDRYLDG